MHLNFAYKFIFNKLSKYIKIKIYKVHNNNQNYFLKMKR